MADIQIALPNLAAAILVFRVAISAAVAVYFYNAYIKEPR